MNKLSDIRDILFQIIDEKYPDIPKEVVEKILTIQCDNIDNKVLAAKQIAAYLESYLNNPHDAQI